MRMLGQPLALLNPRHKRPGVLNPPKAGGAPPAPDPFPAIDGQFYHFRQEDVTASGASTAHGLPLSLGLAGTLARIEFDGREYFDGSKGALHADLATPFPADAPITIWMLTSGHRNSGVFAYLGPPNFAPGSNNLNFRATGSLIVQRTTTLADIATWPLPAAAGPETVAYHRPAGANISSQNFKVRYNGTQVGAPSGAYTATASNGGAIVIGGRRDTSGGVVIGNTASTGTYWRDVVVYVGTPAKPDLSADEIAALEAYAAQRLGAAPAPPVSPLAPAVAVVSPGGYPGTTPTVSPTGEVTITNAATFLSGDLGVSHYLVRADNMIGRKLVAKRSTAAPNNNWGTPLLDQWQMAWTYDPNSDDWRKFDIVSHASNVVTASNTGYLDQDTVYVARRPVFTPARWEAAIARWIEHPLTSPTPSGGSDYVIGTLPANQYAPQMPLYGFKVGTGPTPFVVTAGIHSDEHVVGWASEAFFDWLLSDHADAVWLRSRLTIYAYPRLNPQAHHAGANRVEVASGENANRIFASTGFDSIPLSKTLRDAWAADLPATLGGHYDWHDSIQGVRRGFVYHRNSLAYANLISSIYKARTGIDIVIQASATTGSVSDYVNATFSPAFSITVEHEMSVADSIPQWREWGLDMGRALRQHFGALP